jgi:hypothetical protein
METEVKPLNMIGTMLETTATILQNTSAGLDFIADKIDDNLLFPTAKEIRQVIEDHVHDLKNALAQLENVDAELSRMQ